MKFRHLISELKRRNVYQVGVAYVLSSWIILQVASIILPAFEAPTQVMKTILILLLIGFPLVLAFSWIYELTPEGLKKTEKVELGQSITLKTGRKLNRLLISVLVIAIVLLSIDRFRINRGLQAASQAIENVKISPIPKSIREKKVAVMIFENNTNSDELEIFGKMISDWLTNGLMEISEGKVIGFANIEQNMQLAGAGNTTSQAFAEATSAEVMIQGRYYLQEDNLLVHTNIVDATTGALIFSLNPVSGSRDDTQIILDELTQRILGYWALNDKKMFAKKAPKYDAYQIATEAHNKYWYIDYPKAVEDLNRAYRTDTTYINPLIKMAFAYYNMGQPAKVDSMIKLIRKKNIKLSQREDLRLLAIEHVRNGNRMEAAQIHEKMFSIDSTDEAANYNAGNNFLASNHPQKAINILGSFNQQFFSNENKLRNREGVLATAHYSLGNYQKVCEIANTYNFPVVPNRLSHAHLKALLHLDSLDRINHYLNYYSKRGLNNFQLRNHRLSICVEAKKTGKIEFLKQSLEDLKEFNDEAKLPTIPFILGLMSYLSNDFDIALKYSEQALEEKSDQNGIFSFWGMTGSYAAMAGDTLKAMDMIDSIHQRKEILINGFENYLQYGFPDYEEARIRTNLGQKERAVDLLARAINQGKVIIDFNGSFKSDPFLFSLSDYPPFNELIKPKD